MILKTQLNTATILMKVGDTFAKNDMNYYIKKVSLTHYLAYCYADKNMSNLTAYEVGRLFTTCISKSDNVKLFKRAMRDVTVKSIEYRSRIEFIDFQHVPPNALFGHDPLGLEKSLPYGCEGLAELMFNKSVER